MYVWYEQNSKHMINKIQDKTGLSDKYLICILLASLGLTS